MTGKDGLLCEFGVRVRERRNECGLSQEELAHKSGMHRTYVSSVERGERNIALVNIAALAAALGVDAGDLTIGLKYYPQ